MNAFETEKPSAPLEDKDKFWAATGVDIGLSNIDRIQKSLIRSAELFRNESGADGVPFLTRCLEGVGRFLETVIHTRRALNLDFQRISIEGIALSDIETQSNEILKSISSYQEKQDYSRVADKLEYELLPNLGSWSAALKQVRLSLSNAA